MSRNADFNIVAGLLALALAVGGAGLTFPMLEMLLELCAIGVLAYFVVTPRRWQFNLLSRLALGLLALTILLPLCQLVPLPPGIWHRLPGRDLPMQLDSILGWNPWRPLTLDVESTIRTTLRLLAPTAIFIGCMFLTAPQRGRLFFVIVAFAIFGACLGILQLVSGGSLTPYPSGHQGYPIGLFVNRNHHASFLLASMPCVGALAAIQILRGKPPLPMILGACAILVMLIVVVVGTTSRMGFALLPIGIGSCLFILFRRQAAFRLVIPSLIGIAALLLFLFVSGAFMRTLARFSSVTDNRFAYWQDVGWALQHYGLAGTGVGTFVPVYQSAESLDAMTPAFVNHAHNDYLELLLDGGWVAAVLVLLFLCVFGFAVYRASVGRQPAERALIRTAAAAGIAIFLLSSLVDYPIRMPAISCTFAVLCAVLLPTRPDEKARAISTSPAVIGRRRFAASYWLKRCAWGVPLLILLAVVLQAAVSARAIVDERYDDAIRWAPWSTRAHELQSTAALLQNQPAVAMSSAQAALRLSPIDAPAVRTAGLTRLAEGGAAQGNGLMQIAATLGWRDPITQLWTIRMAERSGEPAKALERAEALLLQQALVAPAITQLLSAPAQDHMTSLLASTLAQQPSWRSTFFYNAAKVPPANLPALEQTLTALKTSKAPLQMTEAQPLLDGLVQARDVGEAQRIWGLLHTDNLVSNGNFDQVTMAGSAALPTDWKIDSQDLGGVAVVQRDSDPRNHALRILANKSSPILAQQLMLQPGSYSFAYNVRVSRGPDVLLRWVLHCPKSSQNQVFNLTVPQNAKWSETRLAFTVPAGDCPIQTLALERSRATAGQQIWLDDLRLGPVTR